MACCVNAWLLAKVLARKKRQSWRPRRVINRFRKPIILLSLSKIHSCTFDVEKKRRWWVRPIFKNHEVYGAWFTLIPEMIATDHERYYNFFRMWPEHFDEILSKVEPYLSKKSWRKAICPEERLSITLRFLASGDSYMSLSYLFRVSDPAISRIVRETCHVIWRVLCPEVFEAPSVDMWLRIAAEFESMWDFPHCLGAIDGVHVNIKAFPHAGTYWFNYNKHHSYQLWQFLMRSKGSL